VAQHRQGHKRRPGRRHRGHHHRSAAGRLWWGWGRKAGRSADYIREGWREVGGGPRGHHQRSAADLSKCRTSFAGDAAARLVFEAVVVPAAERFRPDLVLVSAGGWVVGCWLLVAARAFWWWCGPGGRYILQVVCLKRWLSPRQRGSPPPRPGPREHMLVVQRWCCRF
jgi:hypothetical protein